MVANRPDIPDIDAELQDRIISFWDRNAEQFSQYTEMYLKRNHWVSERLSDLFPGMNNLKIVDIGTGAGFLAISYAQLGHDVTATDLSENMLFQARKNAANHDVKIRFLRDDAHHTALPEETFDLVVLRDVFNNLQDPRRALIRLSRLVRPGGYLMISDGNYFLNRHNETYLQRQRYYQLKNGKGEYEGMLNMDSDRFGELESLVGDLEVNTLQCPEWQAHFVIANGMNNIRIRCDDWEDYTCISELGTERVPLRYTFVCQKPYVSPQRNVFTGKFSRSYFFRQQVESASALKQSFTALSDENRIKLILALGEGPETVSELASRARLSVNKTSYHLNILRDVGVVGSRREGRRVTYFLTDEAAMEYLLFTISELLKHR